MLSAQLDENKIYEYLSKVNKKYYYDVKYILDNTIIIQTETMIDKLIEMVNIYLCNPDNIRPEYVIFPDKVGSEQYFFSFVQEKFNSIKFITIHTKINKDANVLIIDDANLSGTNTFYKIDELTYNNKNINFTFIIIIPYQLQSITQSETNNYLSIEQAIRTRVINVDGFVRLPFIEMDLNYIKNKSSILSPVIFGHKVPNEFGSFPQIYLEGNLFNKKKFGSLFLDDNVPSIKNTFTN